MSKVVRGVNFPSFLFASLTAGYVMAGVDMILEGFLGLFGTYRDYIELVKLWDMFKGYEDLATMTGHMLNSVVLALVFVHPSVYHRLPTRSGLIKGLTFGALWHLVVLFILFVTAFGGALFMKKFLSLSLNFHVSLFLLHLIWAGTLGILYVPEEG